MAYIPLTFHPRCGKYVGVTEGGTKVEKTDKIKFYGGALTARPLRTEEVFTLQLISGSPELSFGVTTHSPESIEFPKWLRTLQGSWCLLWSRDEGWVCVNGEVVNKKFLSVATLTALKEGDTLGLKVTKDRKLSFYLNGKSVGVAATDIPRNVFGFIDLYGAQYVKLIPDIQESSAVREIAYSELEFGDTLGEGGQGAVFKGKWKARSLSVAIKRVMGKIRHEEAGLLSKLSHPNVITFYGICTERYPEYFIITELAEGGSLYSLIHEKHYHPDVEESLRWVKQIAEGMRYLHQEKVIHRDLKSQNVLLTASMTIKLCDFGSAKEFDHTTVQTGTGTYRWIAPEVLKGEKVSLSCDVFSYGMVLFEIFKQEVPFADILVVHKVASMISEGKTPALPISLDPYLANLMKCCWQMNPKSRPSFQEVLIVLEKKDCPEPVSESPGATQDTGIPLTLKDLPHLQTVLDEASGIWYPLGMKLKLDTKTLTGIGTVSENDNSTALSLMLTRWLKSKDQPPLLQSLTDAVCSPDIGLTHLSESLLIDKDQYGQ